jgi:HlyD family secretion protein
MPESMVRRGFGGPAIALLLLVACGKGAAPAPSSAVPVLVADVVLGPATVTLELPGELRSPGEATVSAEIAATVEDAPAREGQVVRRGDVLVRFDDRPQQIALRQAQARLQQADAQRAVRAAALDRVRATMQRLLDVAQQDPAGVSLRDAEDARFALVEAEAALQAATADAAMRAAEVDAAQLDVERTRLRAPVEGTVARQLARVGQRVAPGAELARIAVGGGLEGLFDAGEDQAGRIAAGMPVEVQVAGRAAWTGTVSGVVPAADGASRNQRIRVAIEPPPERWVPGLAARARVETLRLDTALQVPRDAVVQGAVHVVRDDKAARVSVTVLHDAGATLIVEAALQAGDDVVVRGNEALSDGSSVKVIETRSAGGAP